MNDWIRKALTRTVSRSGPRGKKQITVIEPDERLVYGVKFAIAMTICLSALELAHMAFLGSWNSEIFAAIMLVVGTILGAFFGQKA